MSTGAVAMGRPQVYPIGHDCASAAVRFWFVLASAASTNEPRRTWSARLPIVLGGIRDSRFQQRSLSKANEQRRRSA